MSDKFEYDIVVVCFEGIVTRVLGKNQHLRVWVSDLDSRDEEVLAADKEMVERAEQAGLEAIW